MRDRILRFYRGLSQRERVLVNLAAIVLAVTLLFTPISTISKMIAENRRLEAIRAEDSHRVAELLGLYLRLERRLKAVQELFNESEMTFEEVTSEIDRVVGNTVGSDGYDLKKDRTTTKVGRNYEKQGFTLVLKSLTLDQLIKLLYTIENDKRPLFLEKTHIERKTGESYSATIELFSIRKIGA